MSTPGPFTLDPFDNICRREERYTLPVAVAVTSADSEPQDEAAELVDLLNKGTHFDELLAVLKRVIAETESPGFQSLYEAYIDKHGTHYEGDLFCMAVRAAIAKAEGRE